MNRTSLKTAIALGFVAVLIIGMAASKSEEPAPRSREISNTEPFMVRSAILPKSLSFAGEAVPLDDWNVRERLERELLVNTYWQSNTMLMLKRTKRFFSEIEPILIAEGIPEDFKYLALAESGLTNAVSPSGAAGMWQFIKSTAEAYNLTISSEIDERYHLQKATVAASAYFKKSRDQLGSWTNAAAAFNRGRNGFQRDVNSQKDSSYYNLYLNTETSRYIFRILALKLICESPKKYGFELNNGDYYLPVPSYDVTIDTTIHSLVDFAHLHGTTYRDVKLLNPWLRDDHLTVNRDTFVLKMPEILAEAAEE